MPNRMTVKFSYPRRSIETDVATEEELLAFANRVREAGGANILEALLPSRPSVASECLIANAVNFSCSVDGVGGERWPTGETKWFMIFPPNVDSTTPRKISESLGLELIFDEFREHYRLVLPLEIGNAARAFDTGQAFQNLIER